MLSGRRRVRIAAALALVIVVAGGIVLMQGNGAVREPGGHEYCFAEWCVAPLSAATGDQAVTVRMQVRSDTKQASQSPDHPQAWLVDASARQVGGPQPALAGRMGPGDSYVATLVFKTADAGECPTLVVSEGGWPAFLGLGYAPSPFTTRVEWRVCKLTG